MIPKTIHYCWFGRGEKSAFIKKCIASWEKFLPDYTIKCWTEDDFDIDSVPFVKEAYEKKKWAFVTDYVRLHALNAEGGIYMDSDVEILRPFKEEWLTYDFFSAHEYHPGIFDGKEDGEKRLNSDFVPKEKGAHIVGFGILSAVMASVPGHPYITDCMAWYHNISFNSVAKASDVVIGKFISEAAEKYGYRYKNETQVLENRMLILTCDVLVGNSIQLTDESYAIHLVNGSWVERTPYQKFTYNVRNNYMAFYPLLKLINKVLRKLKIVKI